MAAKLARFSWVPGGLAAALVIVAGRFLTPNSSLSLEMPVYDAVMRVTERPMSRDLALIAIDDESLAQLGPWPWPADVHASLLKRLTEDGARVVAFTAPLGASPRSIEIERLRSALALLESSDLGTSGQARQLRELLGDSVTGGDTNAHLSRAIAEHGNVVLPLALAPNAAANSAPELPAQLLPQRSPHGLAELKHYQVSEIPHADLMTFAAALGHTVISPDFDNRVRTDLAFAKVERTAIPSMAVAVAARALAVEPMQLTVDREGMLVMQDQVVQLDASLRLRPHYQHAAVMHSYSKVLAGEIDAGTFEGKIVLVGFGHAQAGLATPVSNATPALSVTASAVSSILEGTTYAAPSWSRATEWAAYVIVVAFAAFALPASGILLGAIATALLAAALLVAEVGLLSSSSAWAQMVLPCLAAAAGFGVYVVGELLRRANVGGAPAKDSAGNLRSLGQTFQKQGQLDLAFETYRRCPLDATTMELLYYLGMDFERRRQLQKASAVYAYIAGKDANYRDLRARRTRIQREQAMRDAPVTRPAPRVAPVSEAESDHDHDPAAVPRSSRTLGRYEIERELGKGAMGVVYLGRDPKINRIVAIKAISLAEEFEEADLAEARARFFREAEMAGRLNHPAIVTVYDAGEDQGLAYIAMEYLRGQHLSHFTDPAHLLPPKSVMLLVARVADALHYAHRQNVVHRDIKPANIMFNPDTDELKITDFGIARLTDTSRTKTGIVLGTPSFMSPEQLEGRTLDGRSDQFALGITLYQLLCGQLPFRAESMPRLMQKIATEPHPSVRIVRPELPACVEFIINRALAKDADARYVTCAEMALALRECAGASTASEPAKEQPKHEWLLP